MPRPVGRGLIGKMLQNSKGAIILDLILFLLWTFFLLPFVVMPDILHVSPIVNIRKHLSFSSIHPSCTPVPLSFIVVAWHGTARYRAETSKALGPNHPARR